jgi:hypothetical protein
MWYTAAKVEFDNFKVGEVFVVSKTKEGKVLAKKVLLTAHHEILKNIVVVDEIHKVEMTQSDARFRFIPPSKDLNAVIEESLMLCESAYC